jgi:tyrosinase
MATGAPSSRHPSVPIKFRRNVARLSVDQLKLLRQAFAAVINLDDDRGYQHWAGIHGLPSPPYCDYAHGRPQFLPWHRAYLYFFERALRDRVPDVMLAWWDWRAGQPGASPGIPAAFDDQQADGQANPLFSAPVNELARRQGHRSDPPLDYPDPTIRNPGARRAPPLPTANEIQQVLALTDFLDFSHQLEQYHGAVHMWVGGHMGQIAFAAYDPIFWAHHTMIDRLWRLWQLQHRAAALPRSILRDGLPPFQMTVEQTLDTTALGYDYALTTRSAAAA